MFRKCAWLGVFVIGMTVILGGCPSTTTPTTTGDTSLTGRIAAPESGKWAPHAQASTSTYTVIAQSDQTGEIYRTEVEAGSEFELDLPEEEEGNTFVVTILGPDGRTVGPVVFDTTDGTTGIAPAGETSLGEIELPPDPTTEPIEPGSDADVDDMLDDGVYARVDGNGVPVGLASHGKGDAALTDSAGSDEADADHDGLIDIFDADDDGNGTVDDFDGTGAVGGELSDMQVSFFMNLKISPEDAQTYYAGTAAEISDRLAVDTVITFDVNTEPSATRTITGANLLGTPGPAYLPTVDQVTDSANGLVYSTWADEGYAFDATEDTGRFEAFVRPNEEMQAGDTFTVLVTFDDGNSEYFTRMINYVFKNIPKLVEYGPSGGAMTAFDISDPGVNGTTEHPILFDGTQDLELVFNPPVDETGAYLTDLWYDFAVFFHDETDGQQLNDSIDVSATWATLPTGFDGGTYRVEASALTLSANNTYTLALPHEIFVDTVRLDDGTTANVGQYQIDITAEAPSGNAAIMLAIQKR